MSRTCVPMPDQEVLRSVVHRGIRVVYHFIGLPWLRGFVERGGLYCAKQLREWGDTFDDDRWKWGSFDKGEAFSGYISCSINPPMGMMTRDKKPVILEIDANVAALTGVAFIGKWSSFKDVLPDEAVNQTGLEWFDNMFLTAAKNHAEPHPGEFLVPTHIPLTHLRRMIFFTQDDLEATRENLRGVAVPRDVGQFKVSVRPQLFGRKMQEEAQD